MESINITFEQLQQLDKESYILVDIRDELAAGYGIIPGAKHILPEKLEQEIMSFPKNRQIILYCSKGVFSYEKAEELQNSGYHVRSLDGGYAGWLISSMDNADYSEKPSAEDIEKSIRKKFHKELFSKFAKAVKVYELIKENDKIAVCISGGKDSMLMAKLFQELQKHRQVNFELVFLLMNPGYSETNMRVIENNAKRLNIPLTIFESNIFDAVYQIEKSPCYLCARMRRGYLYNNAKKLGCNKIALGHHFDDVIETILMGMLYGAQVQTMMPKLHSTNFEGMELIRPMYLIREDDIKHWRDYNKLNFIQCACRFTENCATCAPDAVSESKRIEVKKLIAELKKTNPFIETNIFRSVENVNLSTIIAYKKDGEKHHFLDEY